jgi:hypothetical protein
MTADKIEIALRKAFLAAVPAAEDITAFENVAFDPSTKDVWFSFSYIPNQPVVATLGEFGTDEITGLCQIDFNIKNGRGKQGLATVETALRGAFTAGKRFVEAGVSVRITSCGRNTSGRVVDGFYRYIFTIIFEARIPRNLDNETIPDYVLWGDESNVEFEP